jgi:hypothetical protein
MVFHVDILVCFRVPKMRELENNFVECILPSPFSHLSKLSAVNIYCYLCTTLLQVLHVCLGIFILDKEIGFVIIACSEETILAIERLFSQCTSKTEVTFTD